MRHAPETLSDERRIVLSSARRASDEKRHASRRRFRPMTAALLAGLAVSLLMQGFLFPRGGSVSATTESISTSAADCMNPQPNNSWNLGGTICATATGAPQPANSFRQRRFQWVAPDGSVAQQTDVTTDPQNDTYTVPLSGAFGQVGTWRVQTVDNDGGISSEAKFVVRDPANASADLSVNKFGPIKATAGSNITYTVIVTNHGPDDAQNVALIDTVPANTTFVSETQTSGPTFTCPDDTPPCTLATLATGASATFSLTYSVNAGTPAETVITNTAIVSSTTNELFQPDNSFSSQTTVTSSATTCTVNCPAGITVDNDPNQCSAVVTFSTPTISGACGSPPDSDVTCNPPSLSAFPVGTTVVNCGTQSGGACSFTVTVNDTRTPVQPTITCPGNVTVNEDSPGSSSATVNYPAPVTTGNCVTILCNPPSGSQFSFGTTTVNCTAEDSSNNNVSCSFTVTVNASTCGLDCPDDQTVNESSPGSGSATVNYSTPTTVGDCPALTITCNPPSGSSFPVGLSLVNCSGKDGSDNVLASCSFTVRVNSSSTCAITCPANVTASESPSGSGSATVTYSTPTSTGTCAPDPVSCSPPSGSSFPIGTTTVNCSRSDPAGNDSTCSFTVTVTGGTPCTITCPADITESSGGCGTLVSYPPPTTSGSCGDPNNPDDPNTFSCNPPSGSFFPVGTSTVVCSTDVGATCSFTVTVTGTDTTPPEIHSCAAATFASADDCQGVVPNVTSGVDASDNCTPAGLLTVTQSPAAGTIVGTGTTTIVVTVKDASNNSATCSTTFTVIEPIPPTISCPADMSVTATTGQPSTVVSFSPTVADNCPGATFACLPPSGSAFPLGVTTVSCTATDPSGNQANCTFKVAVSGTLLAAADSFVRNGADNTNEGGNYLLRIQSSGHNRVLARFNISGISTTGLQSATLLFTIAENSDNWGSTGRLLDAHRLLADWTEGNGHTVGSQPSFRGTGEGVTWNCAKDADISNQNDDCSSQWDGGAFAAATASSVLHTNNQTGDVSWNVLADVLAGASNGWVIKKQIEGQSGQVRYYSKEGAVSGGNQNLGPRLVLVFQP